MLRGKLPNLQDKYYGEPSEFEEKPSKKKWYRRTKKKSSEDESKKSKKISKEK